MTILWKSDSLFKNMAKLNARPVSFQEKIFDRLFDKAKIANLAPNEYRAYQKSENMGYSYKNTIDSYYQLRPRKSVQAFGVSFCPMNQWKIARCICSTNKIVVLLCRDEIVRITRKHLI